jgi:hypothetical protein
MADESTYQQRAARRLARMDEIAPRCAFEKWPGQRTKEEQGYWNEHQQLLQEQLYDEAAEGL